MRRLILAYDVNDELLDIPPQCAVAAACRAPTWFGYKMAKYLMHIETVESFKDIRGGGGGYWQDLGYAWYAGI
jgi:DMSO/TMAO reductase YedYZ molybdopterin-dependent catalytic subunit